MNPVNVANPVTLTSSKSVCPRTSNFASGCDFPIPICPKSVITTGLLGDSTLNTSKDADGSAVPIPTRLIL